MTSRHRRAEDGGSRRRDGNRCDKALYLTESSSDTAATGNFLSRLSVDERDRLLKYGETRDYAPGEFFFRQGDPHDGIHVIASGRVRSYYTSPAGREVTLGYWTADHFVKKSWSATVRDSSYSTKSGCSTDPSERTAIRFALQPGRRFPRLPTPLRGRPAGHNVVDEFTNLSTASGHQRTPNSNACSTPSPPASPAPGKGRGCCCAREHRNVDVRANLNQHNTDPRTETGASLPPTSSRRSTIDWKHETETLSGFPSFPDTKR